MKHIHNALFATAFCALVAAPAFAGDPVLPMDQYVKYAKALNSADPADSTNVVKDVVSEAVKAAGDKAQQAAGEIAAALAAVSTVKGEADSAAAASIFENVVAAASNAGSDKAEKLSLAKIAAAAGALVSGGADYVDGAGAGLAKNVAKEVKAALENAGEALADVDAYAIKSVYEAALAALRGGSYKMKEDSGAAELAPAETEIPTGFDSASTGSNPERPGVYLGTPAPVPVPSKKEKKNPTPSGQN